MPNANMLEHANRHDTVVVSGLMAIVFEQESHSVRQVGAFGSLTRISLLLGGQRDSGDVDVRYPREIQ